MSHFCNCAWRCFSFPSLEGSTSFRLFHKSRLNKQLLNGNCYQEDDDDVDNKIILDECSTVTLGLQIFLDHRSSRIIDQKILMTLPPLSASPPFSILGLHWRSSGCLLSTIHHLLIFLHFRLFVLVNLYKFILVHLGSLEFLWEPSGSCALSFRIFVFLSFWLLDPLSFCLSAQVYL